MKAIAIAAALVTLAIGGVADAEDAPATPKIPPAELTVTIEVPEGTSDQDVAAAISSEHAKRDPAAQEAARVAKQKADADQAHAKRIGKVCDSIPEHSLQQDPSLRRMCQ
jgi:hypothetical protein